MNQEVELLQDLNSPEKSIRLQAIEYFLGKGKTPDILRAVEERRLQEPDEECQVLLDRAAGAVKKRIAGARPRELSYEPAKFSEFFKAAPPAERLEILSELSPKMIKSLVDLAPGLLEDETDNFVSSGIIRVFGRSWPRESLSSLSKRIFAPNLSIRVASLEALAHIAPDSLLKELPKLLVLKDPRMRTLAVRGLAAIDMDAAIEHLEAIFTDSGVPMKLAAIQASFYLPFESVKPVLLKFLAMEPEVGLLQRAGLLFEINPDVEVPFRLWELSEKLPAQRSEILKKILQGACRAIQSSGILKEDISSFMERLKNWISQRQAAKFVHEVLSRIENGEQPTPEMESVITRRAADPFHRAMFEKAMEWPFSDETKDSVKRLLGMAVAPSPILTEGKAAPTKTAGPMQAVPEGKPVSESQATQPGSGKIEAPTPESKSVEIMVRDSDAFKSLLPDQQIRVVGSWLEADRQLAQPILKNIFDAPEISSDLLAASIRASIRLGMKEFGPIIEKKMKSDDPSTASAAIEYQGTFNPDAFFPMMGRFLQNSNRRIKGAALKILQQYDQVQAVSMLKAMFRGRDPDQRANAFACLPNFDFPLVREVLVEIIMSNPPEKEFNLCLCLFQANPDPGNLYELFRISKLHYPGQSEKALGIYRENQKFLVECGQLNQEELAKREEEFSRKLAREHEKKAKPLPEYSVKRLAQDNLTFAEKIVALLTRPFDDENRSFSLAALVSIFAFGLIFWGLGGQESGGLKPRKPVSTSLTKVTDPGFPGAVSQPFFVNEAEALASPTPDLFVPADKSVVDRNFAVLEDRARAGKEALEMIASLAADPKESPDQNE